MNRFLKKYPLQDIETDIISIAELNDISIVVPDCVITQAEINDKVMLIESTFHELMRSREFSTDEFAVNLQKFFKDVRNKNKTKKICFYCMLPVALSITTGDFGIHGDFLISD